MFRINTKKINYIEKWVFQVPIHRNTRMGVQKYGDDISISPRMAINIV